jgi:signal transduction histidine kinase
VETFQAQQCKQNLPCGGDRGPLPLVPFDAARIVQVLANLLSNAINFTAAQRSVVVRLAHVADDIVWCGSDPRERTAVNMKECYWFDPVMVSIPARAG